MNDGCPLTLKELFPFSLSLFFFLLRPMNPIRRDCLQCYKTLVSAANPTQQMCWLQSQYFYSGIGKEALYSQPGTVHSDFQCNQKEREQSQSKLLCTGNKVDNYWCETVCCKVSLGGGGRMRDILVEQSSIWIANISRATLIALWSDFAGWVLSICHGHIPAPSWAD